MVMERIEQCQKRSDIVLSSRQGGELTPRPRADNGKYLQYQKKIICDQIRKSVTSPVLQGGFQCHKKQITRINVNHPMETVTT